MEPLHVVVVPNASQEAFPGAFSSGRWGTVLAVGSTLSGALVTFAPVRGCPNCYTREDGNEICYDTCKPVMRVYNVSTGVELKPEDRPDDYLTGLKSSASGYAALSPDGKFIAHIEDGNSVISSSFTPILRLSY